MPASKEKQLTLRERNALTFAALSAAFGQKTQHCDIFLMASAKPLTTLTDSPSLNTQANSFFRRADVIDFLRIEKARAATKIELIKRNAVAKFAAAHNLQIDQPPTPASIDNAIAAHVAASIVKAKDIAKVDGAEGIAKMGASIIDAAGKASFATDYTDRDEMLKALNDQANRATDDKTRLDILKLISQIQQYSQAPGREDEETKRFYMPLKCSECALYEDAKATKTDVTL